MSEVKEKIGKIIIRNRAEIGVASVLHQLQNEFGFKTLRDENGKVPPLGSKIRRMFFDDPTYVTRKNEKGNVFVKLA